MKSKIYYKKERMIVMSKNDVIVVNDVKELEKLDKKDRVVIEDMTGKNRGDLIEYIKDEKKFLEVLYLLNEKEDIEKLIKMRLISGKNLPVKDILLRNEKTALKGSFRYKEYKGLNDENYIQSPMISEGEFEISEVLDKVNENRDSFLNSMIDNSLTNFNIFLFEKTGELYFYGIKYSIGSFLFRINSKNTNYLSSIGSSLASVTTGVYQSVDTSNNSDTKKEIESLLKNENNKDGLVNKYGRLIDTFVIEIEDNPKLIESITDAVYERNQKEKEARNYFNI